MALGVRLTRTRVLFSGIILFAVVLGLVVHAGLHIPEPEAYETTDITVNTVNGEVTTVSARVADTDHKRHVGLSQTTALASDEGMLFVYGESDARTFTNRGMSFGIDIIFIDDSNRITTIETAEPPVIPFVYSKFHGDGQYVLEVPEGWAEHNGVTTGSVVEFDDQ